MALTPTYPNLPQSGWLLLVVIFAVTIVSLPLGMAAMAFDAEWVATHPLFLGVVNIVALGYGVRLGVRRSGVSWRSILPIRAVPKSLLPGMVMSIAGCVLLVSEIDNLIQSMMPVPEYVRESFHGLIGGETHVLFSIFVGMIVAPVTEECLFRGVMLRGFLAHYSVKRAIVVSALLFGAFHLNPWQFPGAVAVGTLLGWWYVRTRSLLPCLFGHALYNGVPILLYGVVGVEIQGLNSDLSGPVQFQPLWMDALGALLLLLGLTSTDRVFRSASVIPAETWIGSVRGFADLLISKARDIYGDVHTPLFVSQIHIGTGQPPELHTSLYAPERHAGAGPRMNNLQFDGGLLRLLYGLGKLTEDRRYEAAADDYLSYYLEHLPLPSGYFPWGDHRGYDVFEEDAIEGHGEFKVALPLWERMYEIDPVGVYRQVVVLRKHILNEDLSLAFDRHFPPGDIPHCANSSAGAWITAWTFLYTQTQDGTYLSWARSMADYLWSLRNEETGLLAAHPSDPAYREAIEDPILRRRANRTEYLGPMYGLAINLLHAQRLLGDTSDTTFRDQALGYIRAFGSRFDVNEDGHFFATFNVLTGSPLFGRVTDGWQLTPQNGPTEAASGVVGLRAPISLAYAYKVTTEPDLLEAFTRFEPLFELNLFGVDGDIPQISAGLLAQAIGAWVNVYEATRELRYLEGALRMADHAHRHYVKDGWFVCGPPTFPRYRDEVLTGWEAYSNRGGSADLALVLLRLCAIAEGRDDVVEEDPACYF